MPTGLKLSIRAWVVGSVAVATLLGFVLPNLFSPVRWLTLGGLHVVEGSDCLVAARERPALITVKLVELSPIGRALFRLLALLNTYPLCGTVSVEILLFCSSEDGQSVSRN